MPNPTDPTNPQEQEPAQLFEYPSDYRQHISIPNEEVASRQEIIFTEPSSHPNAATPLDPYYDEEVKAHQGEISQLFVELIDKGAPKGTPVTFIDSVVAMYQSRFHRRLTKNQANYHKKDSEATVSDPLMLERALRGQATPSELLTVQKELKIPAIELARVTHPFGYREQYVPDTLKLVTGALVEHGGVLIDENDPEYKDEFDTEFDSVILDGPNDKQRDLLVLRKSTIGTIDNIVVRQRSAFIVRTNVHDEKAIQELKADPRRLMDEHEILISLSTAWYAYAENGTKNLGRSALLTATPDDSEK